MRRARRRTSDVEKIHEKNLIETVIMVGKERANANNPEMNKIDLAAMVEAKNEKKTEDMDEANHLNLRLRRRSLDPIHLKLCSRFQDSMICHNLPRRRELGNFSAELRERLGGWRSKRRKKQPSRS